MKTLIFWLATTIGLFALAGGGYTYYLQENPKRILVVLDSSNPMRGDWKKVREVLDKLDDQRHAEFALITEKNRVHGWSSRLSMGRINAYAPRNLGRINTTKYTEFKQATVVYFVTNAKKADLPTEFSAWKRLKL